MWLDRLLSAPPTPEEQAKDDEPYKEKDAQHWPETDGAEQSSILKEGGLQLPCDLHTLAESPLLINFCWLAAGIENYL